MSYLLKIRKWSPEDQKASPRSAIEDLADKNKNGHAQNKNGVGEGYKMLGVAKIAEARKNGQIRMRRLVHISPRLYSGATQTSKKVKKENKNFSVGSQMQSSKSFGQLAPLALPRQLFVCIELRLHVRL